MNELEKIILNGTTLNLTDTTARTTATAAKQTADSASATTTAAKQTADSASATATAAKQAADSIKAGFNTQFEQKSGIYVSPFFCLRNKTVYVEFPNINTNKLIPADSWTVVCNIREIHLPLSTVYRTVTIGGVTVIVELNKNGQMKMYSQTEIPINTPIFGGFSYLTI